MKIKDFLEKLEKNKGRNIIIEVQNEIIKKSTIQQMNYEIKEDELYILSSENADVAVININVIRSINENIDNILIYLEDKKETQIKIWHYVKQEICTKQKIWQLACKT